MSDQVAFNVNLFPDEIISEFLIRLPTKDVCRFKAVSKHWNSIIGNSHFISSYISFADPPWFIVDRTIRSNRTDLKNSSIVLNPTPRPGISTLAVNPLVTKKPAQILQSSNGLVLFAEINGEIISLFVANPVTGEFAPIPKTPFFPVDPKLNTCFFTRADPRTGNIDKFVVVEFVRMPRIDIIQCFSSDTGKWLSKQMEYVFPHPAFLLPYRPFEFDGRLFWVGLTVGLITWDVNFDIFTDCEVVGEVNCRLIPFPEGHYYEMSGYFGGVGLGGRCMQYVEFSNKGDCMLKCWRLEDYNNPTSGWSLVFKVSRLDIQKCLGNGFGKVKSFVLPPPFEPDSVLLDMRDSLLTFNFRTCKVESRANLCGHVMFIPVVIPRWPISIPPRFYSSYAKEEGNRHFKENNFTKAIECYSKSITLSPNVVAYANRAMAYLKINSFSTAEDDCTEALKIDNNYVKGYARRAVARKELGNLEGSKEDAEFALKIEPSDQYLKSLYADVKSLLDKRSSAEDGRELDIAD